VSDLIIASVDISGEGRRQLRRKGQRAPLGNYVREISSILGIEPSQSTDLDFIKMTNDLVVDKKVTCLLENDSDVFVDEMVCRWCPRCLSCKSNSVYAKAKAIHFRISEHPENEFVKRFIESEQYKDQIFKSKDPFQIGWASAGSRDIYCEPLGARIIQPINETSTPWGSLFYCPALLRTLTLFEMQMIERLHDVIDGGGFSNVANFNEQVITGGEFLKWIENFQIDVSSIDGFKDSLETKGFLNNLKDFIEFTSTFHSSGLYDVGTEIAFHGELELTDAWDESIRFLYSLAINLNEMVEMNRFFDGDIDQLSDLQSGNNGQNQGSLKISLKEDMLNQPLVQSRLEVILLIPENMDSVNLLANGFKLIRSKRVHGISIPWLMIDCDFERVPPFTIPVFDNVRNCIVSIPTSGRRVSASSLNSKLLSRIGSHLVHIDDFGEHHLRHNQSNDTKECSECGIFAEHDASEEEILLHYRRTHPFFLTIPYSEWPSLNAIHQKIRDRVSAAYGPEYHRIWNDLRKFLDYQGTFSINSKLRQELSDPLIRKMLPNEAIRQLDSESRLEPIVWQMGELNILDIQRETIEIPVSSGRLVLARNLYRGLEKSKEIGNEGRSEDPFKVVANGGLGNKFILPVLSALNWTHSSGEETFLSEDLIADVDSCLGAIWCSEGVMELLSDNHPVSQILSPRILRFIHSSGNKRVSCFSTMNELNSNHFPPFDSAEHGTIKFTCLLSDYGEKWIDFQDCPVCHSFEGVREDVLSESVVAWHPALAASEFSPQFVFVGGIGG